MSVMSCQVTLYPLDTPDSGRAISDVLAQMDWEGVEVNVGLLSTVILGEENLVWDKIHRLYSLAKKYPFALQITVSNRCGCQK